MNFTPQLGHEQAGTRPGIVLSPKAFNQVIGFAVEEGMKQGEQ